MTFQQRALQTIQPEWAQAIADIKRSAEAIRPPDNTKTGTISGAACAYLMAVTTLLQPRIAVEVGTFIGSSILSIRATKHRYTCDKDHDCFVSREGITAYPKTTSTAMFTDLVSRGVHADFFFFDGRAQDDDLALIRQLSTPRTVYGFDDFTGTEKGVWNVRRFLPWLPTYALIPPPAKVPYVKGETTIALLVPQELA